MRPIMSPSLPIGIISAVMVSPCTMITHATERRVTPKWSAISDNATAIIVMLATITTSAMPMAVNGIHGFDPSDWLSMVVEEGWVNGLR